MIQPTPKAQTLPDDLKKHWEDAMATKFPMTRDEAMAYMLSRYMNIKVRQRNDGTLQAEWQQKEPVIEGQQIPQGWSVQYIDAPDSRYAESRRGLNMSPQELMRLMNTRSIPSYMYRFEQVIIDDFRKTAIDKKLKDYKA